MPLTMTHTVLYPKCFDRQHVKGYVRPADPGNGIVASAPFRFQTFCPLTLLRFAPIEVIWNENSIKYSIVLQDTAQAAVSPPCSFIGHFFISDEITLSCHASKSVCARS